MEYYYAGKPCSARIRSVQSSRPTAQQKGLRPWSRNGGRGACPDLLSGTYGEVEVVFQRRQPVQPASPRKQPANRTHVLGSGPGANVGTIVVVSGLTTVVVPARKPFTWVRTTTTLEKVVGPRSIGMG